MATYLRNWPGYLRRCEEAVIAATTQRRVGIDGVPRRTECVLSFATMRLAGVARLHVLSSSVCGEPDGMPLMVMRQPRFLRRCDNILRLLKFGRLAMVPCGVLVVLSRQLMKVA
jgi:hypothetical protein